MDLTDLLSHASSVEEPAGEPRVHALAAHVRGLDSDLTELHAAATTQFQHLYKDGAYERSDVGTLETLADVIEAVNTVVAERHAEDHKVAQLAARAAAATPDTSAGEGSGGADTPGESASSSQDASAESAPTGEDADSPEEPADEGSASPDSEQTTETGQPGDTAEPDTASSDADDAAPSSSAPEEDAAGERVPALAAAPTTDTTESAAADQGDGGSTTVQNPPARRPSTAAAINASRNTAVHTHQTEQTKPLRSFSITASAEIPEYPFGKTLTLDELADASAARFASLPVGQPAAAPVKANVARINRHVDPEVTLTGERNDADLLDRVGDEKRLPGGSLVAAVQQKISNLTAASWAPSVIQDVWCTPSETDYTLCPPLATRDGLLDLPTVGMPARGGIRYPVWKQYPEQEADAINWRGESHTYPEIGDPNNDPAPSTGLANPNFFREGNGGYPKRCIEGPCVDWREVRASLSYLCITSDILRDRTFPEGIRRFMDDVLVHHAHFMNETYIGHIVSNADPIPAFSVQNGAGQIGSSSLTVIDRLSLLVTWFRNRYKMASNATLEIVAPEWLKEYLKRDIEKKQNRPFGAVSAAEVASLFAQYASRVQWVRDWTGNELGDGQPVGGRVMPPGGWPNQVQILAYPAGSWVLSEGNILTLGVQYDYQLLEQNKYSAMFTEDSWMLVNRCNRTFLVTLTDLCANGAVGPAKDACPDVTSLTVSADPASIQVGQTSQLTATATYQDGSSQDVTASTAWTSSNTNQATVNASGVVSGRAQGTPTITGKYSDQSATANVEVTAAPATAEGASTASTTSGGDEGDTGKTTRSTAKK